jgi:hypothetical protein
MKNSQQVTEKRTEAERMQDVRLLLDHLSRSQETTIKLIIDCLYDVGAVNLINQKIQPQPLNRLSKSVASISKPAFRIIAYQWFKKNCPELITNWLHKKVSFGAKPTTLDKLNAQVVEVLPPSTSSQPPLIVSQEMKRLRAQVRILAGMLVGAIALFGGATLWLVYGEEPNILRLKDAEQSATLERCQSSDAADCQPN